MKEGAAGILLDVDKTLVQYDPEQDKDIISPGVQDAVLQAQVAGIPVMPCTSRSLPLMENVIDAFDLVDPCLLDNGASIYLPKTSEYARKIWLSGDTIKTVTAGILDFCTSISCEQEYNPRTPQSLAGYLRRGNISEAPSVFAEFPNDPIIRAELERYLSTLSEEQIAHVVMAGDTDEMMCVQFNIPGVSKNSGARTLLDIAGLNGKRVLAGGDNTQDKALFQAVKPKGITFAMGNATAELKEQADYVVPSVEEDGVAYAIREYGLPDKKPSTWKYIESPIDPVNRPLMDPEQARFFWGNIQNQPLANAEKMKAFVRELDHPHVLNVLETSRTFVNALADGAHMLFWSDLDLQRACWGIEHESAVLKRGETDFAPLFYDKPLALMTLRITEVLQDSGKGLCKALTNRNENQSMYNVAVAKNILQSMDIPDCVKQAVPLLVGYDGTGKALQRLPHHQNLAELRAAFPAELLDDLDDLLIAIYISDASAHSSYNDAVNPRTGRLEPCVTSEDSNLNFLFTRHPNGSLTLTPDRCAILRKLYKNADVMLPLITISPDLAEYPFPSDGEVLDEVIRQKFLHNPAIISVDQSGSEQTIRLQAEAPLDEHPAKLTAIRHVAIDSMTLRLKRNIESPDEPAVASVHTTEDTFLMAKVNAYMNRDGRVWGQREIYAHTSSGLRAAFDRTIDWLDRPEDTHGDAWLGSTIRNIESGLHQQSLAQGRPLANSSEAWRLIRWIEKAKNQDR